MQYLTNDKLVIVGAGGMIGSNMVQSVLMLGLTPNICLYDIYEPGVHGVFDEIQQCAFEGANITYTVDAKRPSRVLSTSSPLAVLPARTV